MTTPNETEYFLKKFSELSHKYLSELSEQPVAKLAIESPNTSFQHNSRSSKEAVSLLTQQVIPYLSGSAGPRYWGFVTGGANPAALFADWLVSTFDQNVSKDGDSIASAIEHQTLDWVKSLFYLPDEYNGIVTTGATSANFLAAVIARQFAGQQQSIDIAQHGMQNLSVEIFSASPHASMTKSLGLAGFGQQQITQVQKVTNTEQMSIKNLAAKLHNSNAKSKIVIASSATVTATSFDDLMAISKLCKQHQAWLHVDAAFGIFERLLNPTEGKTKGIEFADSITVDFHKWLNVPYDAGAIFTRHQNLLVQSCDVNAPYLSNGDGIPAFLSMGIENSRRFRALPIWFTLLRYGREGIKTWVEKNITLAAELANWISDHPNFELALECQLNVVVFRPLLPDLTNEQADKLTRTFMEEINKAGVIFLSAGNWQERQMIRAALSNWQTSEADIELAKKSMQATFDKLANQ